jgi:uncharacterized Zn finger protein (UPF0148 family)
MSDFDREEERRKLEEQFGEEAEDRERTERLSDLLLKGATMTDIHCPECGDPIFQHEGRQFCPSCQREVATGDGEQATAGQAAAQNPTSTDAADPAADGHEVEVETPDTADAAGDAAAGNDTDVTESSRTDPPAESSPSPPEQSQQPQQPQQSQPSQQPPSQPTAPSNASRPGGAAPQPSPAPAGDDGSGSGLLPARQHLTRTVNRLAQQAAAEEDPGRKREFLAATREAAEALAAVRDAE